MTSIKMADFPGSMFLPVLITGNSNAGITYGWPRLSAFACLHAIRIYLPSKIVFIYDFIKSRNGFLWKCTGNILFLFFIKQEKLFINRYCFFLCKHGKHKGTAGFAGFLPGKDLIIKKIDNFINKNNFTYEKCEGYSSN